MGNGRNHFTVKLFLSCKLVIFIAIQSFVYNFIYLLFHAARLTSCVLFKDVAFFHMGWVDGTGEGGYANGENT